MKDPDVSRSAEERSRDMAGAVGSNPSRLGDRAASERGRQLAQEIPAKRFGKPSEGRKEGSTAGSTDRDDAEATPADTATLSDSRYAQISRMAYAKAEQRGFQPGGELDDWLAAEREYDEQQGRGVVG
jgi:hypothetical protein